MSPRPGTALRLKVVAAGADTAEHHDFLRADGCVELKGYFFQGHFVSTPLPAEEAPSHPTATCKNRFRV